VAAPAPEQVPAALPETQATDSTAAPQGLFARVSQRLETKDQDAVELSLDNAIQSLDKQQREQMIYSLKRQLVRYTGNLNKLMEDAAMYGSLSSAPLKLQNEIEEIEQMIADLQAKLTLLEQQP
jgi:prefoldin subunit 5